MPLTETKSSVLNQELTPSQILRQLDAQHLACRGILGYFYSGLTFRMHLNERAGLTTEETMTFDMVETWLLTVCWNAHVTAACNWNLKAIDDPPDHSLLQALERIQPFEDVNYHEFEKLLEPIMAYCGSATHPGLPARRVSLPAVLRGHREYSLYVRDSCLISRLCRLILRSPKWSQDGSWNGEVVTPMSLD